MVTYRTKILLILSGSLMAIALMVLAINLNLMLAHAASLPVQPAFNLSSMSAHLMALSPTTATPFRLGCNCPACLAARSHTI